MTQSSDRQRKQPLPVPPLIPQTKPQGITDTEDKTSIIPSSDPFCSLDNKTTISPQQFNIPDFDDNDDLESEEKTQLNNHGMLPPLNNQGKFPPLTPPSLSPLGRSSVNNQNIQSKGHNTMPMGGVRPLSPPPRMTMTAKPGETDVRKGSVMDKSAGATSLRAGPQGGIRSSSPPVGRAEGQPSLHELVQIAYDNGYS